MSSNTIARTIVFVICIVVLLLAILSTPATTNEDALSAVESMGFTEGQVIERYDWTASYNGCGEGDSIAFKVQAKNPQGKLVLLTACKGMHAKGFTFRVN